MDERPPRTRAGWARACCPFRFWLAALERFYEGLSPPQVLEPEGCHEVQQRVYGLAGQAIVDAHTEAAHQRMPEQLQQSCSRGLGYKGILQLPVPLTNSAAGRGQAL